ncbi:DUF417 family protein [Sphingomonas sp.]|uniref:YkgB family protein n=1 Tax=Sphingomonas sp. TaxID=28214 RepID=UPI00286CA47A|nr:DUF417 family protein [Sphingomonas sp.]
MATQISGAGSRDDLGISLVRWSIVLIFFWFGGMKFAAYEAEGVAGIAQNYWAFGWLYPLVGVAGASAVIGVIELTAGVMIALGQRVALASLLGGLMGVATFLITLSFMLTAPTAWQEGYGFPALGSSGQFLMKDVVLLAACAMLARDGWRRYQAGRVSHG